MKKFLITLVLVSFLALPFQAKAITKEETIANLQAQIATLTQIIQILQQLLVLVRAQETQQAGQIVQGTPLAQPEQQVQQLTQEPQTMPIPQPTPIPQGLTPEEKEKLKKEKTEKEVLFKTVTQYQIDRCALDRKSQLRDYSFFIQFGIGKAEANNLTKEQVDSYVSQNPQDANFSQAIYLECISPESTRQKTPEQMEARNRIFEIDRLLEK